jgi:Carbohydrate esterase, sialic acid-specific acetylesterase
MKNGTRPATRTIVALATLICMANVTSLYAQNGTVNLYRGPKEKLHVYLLAGQSNMAGRSPLGQDDMGVIQGCYLLNGEDSWEPAKNPLNRYSTVKKENTPIEMNPGYLFAKTILEHYQGISLGLVVNARGNTSIEEWAKGTSLYNEAIRRTRIAQKTGVLKGILWHQGENNANDANYLEKLKTLISNLRNDLDEPNLPFVAGQVNGQSPVNDLIAKLPEAMPVTGFVSSVGLTGDIHFDAKSMKVLGQRYAEVMMKIQVAQQAQRPKSLP